VDFLARYGLVQVGESGQQQVSCPLFTTFVREWGEPNFTFDLNPPISVIVNDRIIDLTLQEYRFMEALWKTVGDTVSYDDLLVAIYPKEGERQERNNNALAKLAKRVREKINVVPRHDFIKNVRGVGYVLHIRHRKD
jgi:DNA-binding response OmpR family regulator